MLTRGSRTRSGAHGAALDGPWIMKPITDRTRFVLGDWVCTPPDPKGDFLKYRLVAWSTTTERWLLYRDGLDPFVSGRAALMMPLDDLQDKGYRKLNRLRTTRCANAPVYLLQRSGEHVSVLMPGTDPSALA